MDDRFTEALFQFFGASSRVLFDIREGLKPDDMTQRQYDIMEYIYFTKQATLSEISQCLYLSMPNASREVKKLSHNGYVTKVHSDEDKRMHFIVLSDKGIETMTKVMTLYESRAIERYGHIEDKEALIQLVEETLSKLLF